MVKTCSICLEDLEPRKNLIILGCSHHFHINCYTSYILHNVKDIYIEEIVSIKCPMCRAYELDMYPLIMNKFADIMDKEICNIMFVDEIEDIIIKEFLPQLQSILHNNYRFSKRNIVNVLKKVIKDNSKTLKALIKDMRA